MRLALIFNTTRPDTIGIYVARACRALGLAADHWELSQAGQIPPSYDLYLRIDHGDDYFTPLPAGRRPAVFYAIDTHLPHSWKKIRRVAPRYDLVLCCHRDGAQRLPGAEWLPVAADVPQDRPRSAAPEWGVAFVGTDGGVPRKFYLQALRERYPGSRIGAADHRLIDSIYGRSRIGFNYAIADDVNMRVFEVMAANALLVTNALRRDDFSRLGFHDRRHLVLYRSPAELFALIDYYLAHEDERRSIAEAGARLVMERHTYVHRMRQLLECVSRRLSLSAAALAPEACLPAGRQAMTCASL